MISSPVEFVDLAAGDRGEAGRSAVSRKVSTATTSEPAATTPRRRWWWCPRGWRPSPGTYSDRIAALERHVADDRPPHVPCEIGKRLVETVLRKCTADDDQVEYHQPTVRLSHRRDGKRLVCPADSDVHGVDSGRRNVRQGQARSRDLAGRHVPTAHSTPSTSSRRCRRRARLRPVLDVLARPVQPVPHFFSVIASAALMPPLIVGCIAVSATPSARWGPENAVAPTAPALSRWRPRPRSPRRARCAVRILGERDLVEMTVIPAECAENIGGVPVGEVVDRLTTTPLLQRNSQRPKRIVKPGLDGSLRNLLLGAMSATVWPR